MMNIENKSIKSCGNCRYYVRYYIKMSKAFRQIPTGHCKYGNRVKYDLKKSVDFCEHWADDATQKNIKKQNLRGALLTMAEDLRKITEILESDDEENETA